jgi:hypothetical protein
MRSLRRSKNRQPDSSHEGAEGAAPLKETRKQRWLGIAGCVVVFGSGEIVVFYGSWWDWLAYLGFLLNLFVVWPLLRRRLRRASQLNTKPNLYAVLAVRFLVPSAWLWCLVRMISNSWVWATSIAVPVGYLALDFAVWRARQRNESAVDAAASEAGQLT